MKPSFSERVAFCSLAIALLFAVIFTLVDVYGRWPGLPYRSLRDVDLAAGFIFAGAVVLMLVRARRGGGRN